MRNRRKSNTPLLIILFAALWLLTIASWWYLAAG